MLGMWPQPGSMTSWDRLMAAAIGWAWITTLHRHVTGQPKEPIASVPASRRKP
jgi:hypothetical protein